MNSRSNELSNFIMPRALDDLRHIRDYIARRNAENAAKFRVEGNAVQILHVRHGALKRAKRGDLA